MKISPKVWQNGEFIDWDDARIHVMSHVVNYGSSVFEGIRCYETQQGLGGFPADRTHAAADQFGQDLPDGLAVQPRQILRRDRRAHPAERSRRVLHPPGHLSRP